MTWVLNLATGAAMLFSLPPEEAVVAARRWELEDRNTWRPPGQEVRVTRGRWTVGCGDWAAMTEA